MTNAPPIVNYAQLSNAFSANLDAFKGRGIEAAGGDGPGDQGMSTAELIAFIKDLIQGDESTAGRPLK